MMQSRSWYAAFFRVAIALLLLTDIVSNFWYAQEIYQLSDFERTFEYGFIQFLRENIHVFLSIYVTLLVLFLFGIGKNWISALVFIFFSLEFLLIYPAVFWGDYVLKISLLYFVFVDSFKYFSIQKSKKKFHFVSQLAVLAIMFNVCLVYISNAYFKLNNIEWLSGNAIAYFFGFSEVLDLNDIGSIFRNNSHLTQFSTWFVLVFQITFPVAVWFKKTKFLWILVGILLHIIMAVTLQLYKFELILILLYGFFVTDEEWKRLFNRTKIKL